MYCNGNQFYLMIVVVYFLQCRRFLAVYFLYDYVSIRLCSIVFLLFRLFLGQ